MSIKPITYQGVSNFKSNLYALEVKSRFINQDDANGYYKGYGEELRAIVSGNVITIGSGAFLIQGRMNEIETGGETVEVPIQNGYVGYVIARIETYHPDDSGNCTLVAKTGANFDLIKLTQEDTYQRAAESENKIYELPIYSFSISEGTILNVTKLIFPVEENTKTRDIAETAAKRANDAKSVADAAASSASAAVTASNDAKSVADTAASNASAALNDANYAKTKVDEAIAAVANVIYPVGSIYISVNATNPQNYFGGDWVAWGAGRVPVGVDTNDNTFSTVEKQGGEKSHTLIVSEMPNHAHLINNYKTGDTLTRDILSVERINNACASYSGEPIIGTQSAGGGTAHNNLQPYITCYMWKRVS